MPTIQFSMVAPQSESLEGFDQTDKKTCCRERDNYI